MTPQIKKLLEPFQDSDGTVTLDSPERIAEFIEAVTDCVAPDPGKPIYGLYAAGSRDTTQEVRLLMGRISSAIRKQPSHSTPT